MQFRTIILAAVAMASVSSVTQAATRITFTQGGYTSDNGTTGGVASGTFLFSAPINNGFFDRINLITANISFTLGNMTTVFSKEEIQQITFLQVQRQGVPVPETNFFSLFVEKNDENPAFAIPRRLRITKFPSIPAGDGQFLFSDIDGGLNVASTNEDVSTTYEAVPDTIPAVPEPATWAMMLIGFGMIGATTRYRRRASKITYA